MKRRKALQIIAASGIGSQFFPVSSINILEKMNTRIIPATGEFLPVVGLGTWQTFDIDNNQEKRQELKRVLKTLTEKGGSMLDSSPMYGSSEEVAGDLSKETGLSSQLFMATKVWTTGEEAGIRQMNQSMQLMRTDKMDLMQIHNLTDWKTHMRTLRKWKEKGKIRYWGLTHYHQSAYNDLVKIIKQEKPDFVQINFSLAERDSIKWVIPTAAENGAAIIVNRPYGGGSLFPKVKHKNLPEWAEEFEAASWGQFFLKYILAHKEVTCVIPGTSKAKHMADNAQAGFGKLPDEKTKKKIVEWMIDNG